MYDIFLTTGGVKLIGGGSDVWMRYWAKYIAPNLENKSYLLIDRPDPDPGKDPIDIEGVEIVYREDDEEWFQLLDQARKIHVLHMYYHERDTIKRSLSKIDSLVLHVCTELTIRASDELGLPNNKFHHFADKTWENSIIPHIPNPVWIGVNSDTPFHEKYNHIKNIPNLYVFKKENELVYSDRVGYAARIESRKCPHYLQGLDSSFFTSYKELKAWENEFGHDFSDSKVYEFDWRFVENFYSQDDWGIFHGCYRAEPFGYSIFQSLDYGKIPIIEDTWDPSFEYEFRANDKESFHEQVENIRSLDKVERSRVLEDARNKLKKKYGDPKEWASSYLKIYNQ